METIARTARGFRAPASETERDGEISCEIVLDDSALCLLGEEGFGCAWDALLAACPWGTAFQRRDFVATWYDVYATRYRPVLVVGHGSDGALRAVLPLAAPVGGGDLVAAGTHHAEYQGWLSSAEEADAFMRAALGELRRRFPGTLLTFLYLAPGAPTGWTEGTDSAHCALRPVSRALLDTSDPRAAAASLRKKGNRTRMSRLRRSGEVVFERVTDPEAFTGMLREAIPLYELRQGAVNGALPFTQDPLKQRFHEALFELPEFLHVTTLRAGGSLVAGHVGVLNRRSLVLGVVGHDAAQARQSPGKLLLLHLAHTLAEDGIDVLDMTPGSGWKDRFASEQDEALLVHVFFSRRRALAHRARLALDRVARRCVHAVGSSPDAVRAVLRDVRTLGPWEALRRRCRGRHSTLYAMPAVTARRLIRPEPGADFALDATEDVLHARELLSGTLALLERPSTPYTRVEDGRLTALGFVTSATRRWRVPQLDAEVQLPDGSLGVHLVRGGRDLLQRMVADAAATEGAHTVWVAVSDGDAALHDVVRDLGMDPRLRATRSRTGEVHVERLRRSETCGRSMDGTSRPARHHIKSALLWLARGAGLFAIARRMTAGDLRILCYHGFALHDESAFGPRLFMESDTFGQRMDRLRALGYTVLGLEDALRRLEAGDLPPAATVITIDDGPWSFISRGLEHLVRNGFPATLYQTTYYTVKQVPVFRMALQYALWRSPLRSLDLDGLLADAPDTVDLTDAAAAQAAIWRVIQHGESHLDEVGRQGLAEEMFVRLGVDWPDFRESRLVGLLSGCELRELLAAGVDLQLHTHRHRLPVDPDAVHREIAENRAVLETLTDRPLTHLCYPSGEYDPRQFPWLRDLGIRSATTCEIGLVRRGTERLALPRILDGECVSQVEFEAEMSGFLELVRRVRRRVRPG